MSPPKPIRIPSSGSLRTASSTSGASGKSRADKVKGVTFEDVNEDQPVWRSQFESDVLEASLSELTIEGHEYGEEPLSLQDNVEQRDIEEVFNRQSLPPSAAREQPSLNSLSVEELQAYLISLNDVHIPSKIRDGLYITNFPTARCYLRGRGNRTKGFPKIGHILSVINFRAADDYETLEPKFPSEFPEDSRLVLRVKDSTQVNLMQVFPRIIRFIVKALNEGGTEDGQGKGVLVHCYKGMSRSVAAVMAYLVWAEKKSVIETFRQVKKMRIVAWPNSEFWNQLILFVMWNCKLTDKEGKPLMQYMEYVVEKGLKPAMAGLPIDLACHLDLEPPKKWPLKHLIE